MDVLIDCVRTATDGTQPVKCWDAERAGEVPIGCAAGGALAQLEAELRRDGARDGIQPRHCLSTLERRPVDRAYHLHLDARVVIRESAKRALQSGGVSSLHDAHIDFC